MGVGSAVSEAFVRALAAGTGGECELVSPREGMADRVVRHFERMRAPRAKRVTVRWPAGAADITPARIGAVFEGDTVVACARFDRAPAHGAAILEVETDMGEIARQELVFPASTAAAPPDGLSTVARVAAAARLKELDADLGQEVALRYRLVSPWTNWLVVAPRADEEKALDLPALRKVPQTLAAGWGSLSSVGSVGRMPTPSAMRVMAASQEMYSFSANCAAMADSDLSEIEAPRRAPPADLPEPCRQLLELVDADVSRLDSAGALGLLTDSGVAAEFDDLFWRTDKLDLRVEVVAAIVLARLLGGPLGEFVPDDAQAALASLQERAREATDALREMGRHGIALVRLTQGPVGREILEQRSNGNDLERFAAMRELLTLLDEAVRRSQEHLQHDRAGHAHREGRAIA